MAPAPFFVCEDPALEDRIAAVLRRVPPLSGRPIRVERKPGLCDRQGPIHAASFLRERRMAFDCTAVEFRRIFVHELFHFAWVRLGNADRWSFEELVRREWQAGARGELGWSAEWRKAALKTHDIRSRTLAWREYCCESFCDTAAWLYSGNRAHSEYTLARRCRPHRETWFRDRLNGGPLSI